MNKELLDGVRNKMEMINKKMTVFEECATIYEETKDKKLCFLTEDGRVIDVSRQLEDSQLETCSNFVRLAIKSNAEKAQEWLEKEVDFIPNENVHSFGYASENVEDEQETDTETSEENNTETSIEADTENLVELTVENVKKMVDAGMTRKQIAEKTGASSGTLSRFMTNNNIRKTDTPR